VKAWEATSGASPAVFRAPRVRVCTYRGTQARLLCFGQRAAHACVRRPCRNTCLPSMHIVSFAQNRALPARDGAKVPQEFAALSLDHQGVIRDCTVGAAQLFKGSVAQLRGLSVSHFLPRVAMELRNGRFGPRLAFLFRCGVLQQAVATDGERFLVALSVVQLGNPGVPPFLVVVEKGEPAAGLPFSDAHRSRIQGSRSERRGRPQDRRGVVCRLPSPDSQKALTEDQR